MSDELERRPDAQDARPVPTGDDRGTLPPERVRAMFDRIARPYDTMNRVMTAGLDRQWRRLAADAAGVGAGASVLDACCGTGDLALELARRVGPGGEVIGVDFSEGMLDRARAKAAAAGVEHVEWVLGDALALPVASDRVAAATVAFGIRNLSDPEGGFRELVRVVRPGGTVVCLEITTPDEGVLAAFYKVWFDGLVPAVGRLVDRDASSAYSYLPASVRRFPDPPRLGEIMYRAGLADVRFRTLAGGIVALHVGRVPRRAGGRA
jgi:demethylmenaquinone methyltransferase/2-methoxy-6-polyprenyl-1,4-benzoquinol methylase